MTRDILSGWSFRLLHIKHGDVGHDKTFGRIPEGFLFGDRRDTERIYTIGKSHPKFTFRMTLLF